MANEILGEYLICKPYFIDVLLLSSA